MKIRCGENFFTVQTCMMKMAHCKLFLSSTGISFFQDSLALVRLDDLFLESFEVTDGEQCIFTIPCL